MGGPTYRSASRLGDRVGQSSGCRYFHKRGRGAYACRKSCNLDNTDCLCHWRRPGQNGTRRQHRSARPQCHGCQLSRHRDYEQAVGNLNDLVPNAATIAVLVNPNNLEAQAISHDAQEASRALGFEALPQQVSSARDFDSVFERLVERRIGAILMAGDTLFLSSQHQLIALAARHRIPALFEQRESVLAGGLVSYGPSAKNAYRSAGIYVSRLLKGAKPSELPIQ